MEYPRYVRHDLEKTGRLLIQEIVSANHHRYYYPDNSGRLRLVLINDQDHREKRAVAPQSLAQEFGVTPEALFMRPTPWDSPETFVIAETLEHLNYWPKALYPDGQPKTSAPELPMPALPLLSGPDAWI